MMHKDYNAADLEQLALASGTSATILAVADFSPGAWWGFNGVQSLILTADQLFIVQKRFGGRAGRLRQSMSTGAIRRVDWTVQRRLGRESVSMTLTTEGRSQRYTSKWSNASDFAELAAEQRKAA
jgi:hypothetical protein